MMKTPNQLPIQVMLSQINDDRRLHHFISHAFPSQFLVYGQDKSATHGHGSAVH